MIEIKNVFSAFDGCSGGQLALNDAGVEYENYYSSETDKFAIKITQKNFKNTIQLGDIRFIKASDLPKIDLLIGGSPCQDLTFSGKRNGLTTKCSIEITTLEQYLQLKEEGFEFEGQSYLFWEFVRLLRDLKPKYFLLENVKMAKKWQDIFSEAIGCEPIPLNSERFSAQRRQRLYWTNIPVDLSQLPDSELVLKDIIESKVDEEFHLSKKHHEAFLKSYKWKDNDINSKSKPLLASYYKQPPHCPYIVCEESESGYRMLTPLECERLQCFPDYYTYSVSKTQRYKMIGNGWNIKTISFIFKGLKK